MMCLTPALMSYFLATAGLSVHIHYPMVTVLSETPRIYVWRNGMFCEGGEAL